MIFVTIGTTLTFDPLIEKMDSLVGAKRLQWPVVCQIGNGSYEPKNCKYFRFEMNMDEYMHRAKIVVGHGGTGTVCALIRSGRPFVAVANPTAAGNHQEELLRALGKLCGILWTTALDDVEALIRKAPNHTYKPIPEQGSFAEDLFAHVSG